MTYLRIFYTYLNYITLQKIFLKNIINGYKNSRLNCLHKWRGKTFLWHIPWPPDKQGNLSNAPRLPACGRVGMTKFARDIHFPQRKTRKKSAVWVPGRLTRYGTFKVCVCPEAGRGTEPTITLLLTSDSTHFLIWATDVIYVGLFSRANLFGNMEGRRNLFVLPFIFPKPPHTKFFRQTLVSLWTCVEWVNWKLTHRNLRGTLCFIQDGSAVQGILRQLEWKDDFFIQLIFYLFTMGKDKFLWLII